MLNREYRVLWSVVFRSYLRIRPDHQDHTKVYFFWKCRPLVRQMMKTKMIAIAISWMQIVGFIMQSLIVYIYIIYELSYLVCKIYGSDRRDLRDIEGRGEVEDGRRGEDQREGQGGDRGGKRSIYGGNRGKSQKDLKDWGNERAAREKQNGFLFYLFSGTVFATLNFPICNKKFFSGNFYLLKGTS